MTRTAVVVFTFFLTLLRPSFASAQDIVPRGEPIAINYDAGYDAPGGRPGIAGDGNNFLTVWKDTRNQATHGRDPWAARVSRDGVVLDPNGIRLSTSTRDAQGPSVAFDGTYYLVVWSELVTPADDPKLEAEIYGSIVATDGTVVASDIPIMTTGRAYFRVLSIAYDGTNFMIAWRTAAHHIRAMRLHRSGTTITSLDGSAGFAVTSTTNDEYPWITFGSGQYLVVWHRNSGAAEDVYAARITTAGVVLDPGGFAVAVSPAIKGHASVAASGSNYIVTYRDQTNEDIYRNAPAYAKRVSPAGVVLDTTPILLAEDAHWGQPMPVVFDGTNYIAIYQVDVPHNFRYIDVMGRRISPDGAVVDATPFPVAASYRPQGWLPLLAYSNGRLLAAWDDHGRDYLCARPACLVGQMFDKLPPAPPSVAAAPNDVLAAPAADSGWQAVSSPVGIAIHGVDALDDATAYAGTDESYPLRLSNGSWVSWTGDNAFRGYDLGVWANGPTDVLMAGGQFAPKRYSGFNWFWQSVDPQRGLSEFAQGLWSSGSNNLFIVGTSGRAIRFDGTNYIADPTGTALDLWDVWGTATNNVYAVGENGLVLHWNGTAWSRVPNVPSRQNLNAIWGTSATNIFVVGDFGTILHYDGVQWTAQASGTTKHLTGVSGLSPTLIFASGFSGTILRYNGVNWTSENSGTTTNLLDVAVGGNTVWAVGDYGVIRRNIVDASHCTRSLDRTNVPVTTEGGTQSVNFSSNCAWRAWSDTWWISMASSSNGTGDATVSFTVQPNSSGIQRVGTVKVGTRTVTVTQAATSTVCHYVLLPTSYSVPASAATGSFGVFTSIQSCQWTAQSNVSWITITTATAGAGNSQVGYSVLANTDAAERVGTLLIGGQTFTVTQAGATAAGCTFTLNSTSANHGAGAATGSVTVAASQGSCQWTAQSNASWLSITSAVPVTGSATAGYAVLANGGTSPRSGTLTIAGHTFTVTQAGAALPTLQAPANFAAVVTGNTVTTSWTMPAGGVPATGFVLEGGLTPGSVLASVPTGSTALSFSVTAPTGVFYIRLHALAGSTRSPASNEVRIAVNVPMPPAAPAGLVGEAFGSHLRLAWRNQLHEGTPTAIVLDVSGGASLSMALPAGESFVYSGVPPGTYTFAVRAANGSGSSAASNPVTLTFPAACVAAGTPANFSVTRSGNVITVAWNRGAAGPTPTGYVLTVTGAVSATLPVAQTTISGAVGPGSYTISVAGTHPCGNSPPTAPQTVVVP